MKGDVDEAVAAGAHALFMPHGLGHMMGLDVHDMEALGENYVGYNDEVKRSASLDLHSCVLHFPINQDMSLLLNQDVISSRN